MALHLHVPWHLLIQWLLNNDWFIHGRASTNRRRIQYHIRWLTVVRSHKVSKGTRSVVSYWSVLKFGRHLSSSAYAILNQSPGLKSDQIDGYSELSKKHKTYRNRKVVSPIVLTSMEEMDCWMLSWWQPPTQLEMKMKFCWILKKIQNFRFVKKKIVCK